MTDTRVHEVITTKGSLLDSFLILLKTNLPRLGTIRAILYAFTVILGDPWDGAD